MVKVDDVRGGPTGIIRQQQLSLLHNTAFRPTLNAESMKTRLEDEVEGRCEAATGARLGAFWRLSSGNF